MIFQGPVCRGGYRVPFAGMGSFEVNRTIVNLLESLSHPESKPMLEAKCAICKLDDTITVNPSFLNTNNSIGIALLGM